MAQDTARDTAPGMALTTFFWQHLLPAEEVADRLEPPFVDRYPARLADGRYLDLPLRQLPGDSGQAVASFIANHAAFEVVEALAGQMATAAGTFGAEGVVGLPTLGLTLAPLVARLLGFSRYLPLGYSRKYWYREELSVPARSITTPDASRQLYVDPHLVPELEGRRVVLVDDAISTGRTVLAALELMDRIGAEVAGIVVAMVQGERWREPLAARALHWPERVAGAFRSPRFRYGEGGWWPA